MKNLKITVNGTLYDVQVEEAGASSAPAAAPAAAPVPAAAPAAKPAAPAPKAAPTAAGAEIIKSPMPGTIVNVVVTPGQKVSKGDVLVVLEAMKMENEIVSPRDTVIVSVNVNKGDSVNSGTPLVSLQ